MISGYVIVWVGVNGKLAGFLRADGFFPMVWMGTFTRLQHHRLFITRQNSITCSRC